MGAVAMCSEIKNDLYPKAFCSLSTRGKALEIEALSRVDILIKWSEL